MFAIAALRLDTIRYCIAIVFDYTNPKTTRFSTAACICHDFFPFYEYLFREFS